MLLAVAMFLVGASDLACDCHERALARADQGDDLAALGVTLGCECAAPLLSAELLVRLGYPERARAILAQGMHFADAPEAAALDAMAARLPAAVDDTERPTAVVAPGPRYAAQYARRPAEAGSPRPRLAHTGTLNRTATLLVDESDGRLAAVLRTRGGLAVTLSTDGGATWSAQRGTGLWGSVDGWPRTAAVTPLYDGTAFQIPAGDTLIVVPVVALDRDDDGDTLTNIEEEDRETNPARADSDGDGVDDDIDMLPLNPSLVDGRFAEVALVVVARVGVPVPPWWITHVVTDADGRRAVVAYEIPGGAGGVVLVETGAGGNLSAILLTQWVG